MRANLNLQVVLAILTVIFSTAIVQSAPSSSSSTSSSNPILHDYPDSYDADRIYRSTDLDDGDGTGDDDNPGWIDPRINGGSMLDLVGNGLREPINVIISGKSDPTILSDAGLRDYVRTIGFSFECLDLHLGGLQRADLGDGKGWEPENFEYRETQWPGAPGRWVGACWESLYGGNHFRGEFSSEADFLNDFSKALGDRILDARTDSYSYRISHIKLNPYLRESYHPTVWKQNGTLANSGAWFFAVSKEKNLRRHHTIDHDGYNVGRDLLVEAAIKGGVWKTWQWKAKVEWVDGLLEMGRHGINHNISQDGRTAVLTVDRVLDGNLNPLPFPHAHQSDFEPELMLASTQEQENASDLFSNLVEGSSKALDGISSPIFKVQQKVLTSIKNLNLF